jgi:hypothetical protein
MRSLILTLALTCLATPAVAATCEESFQKKGDFFSGAAFSGQIEVEGLTVEKAFAQLRPILARESIKTLSTDLELGLMKAENPATPFQRALPIDIFARKNGTALNVEMVFTLPGGVGGSKSTIRKYICGALNQLLPANTTVSATSPKVDPLTAIAVDSVALTKQVKEAGDNPARIRVNFIGKTFRVSGKVVGIADTDGLYTVSFDGTQPAKAPAKPLPMTVQCTMAKNQDATVAALQTNQRATLVGVFQGVDTKTNTIKLQDCVGR